MNAIKSALTLFILMAIVGGAILLAGAMVQDESTTARWYEHCAREHTIDTDEYIFCTGER